MERVHAWRGDYTAERRKVDGGGGPPPSEGAHRAMSGESSLGKPPCCTAHRSWAGSWAGSLHTHTHTHTHTSRPHVSHWGRGWCGVEGRWSGARGVWERATNRGDMITVGQQQRIQVELVLRLRRVFLLLHHGSHRRLGRVSHPSDCAQAHKSSCRHLLSKGRRQRRSGRRMYADTV